MAVLRRSWRDVDAFTLQIHRYSQALIDLACVDSQLIRYCVAGEVCTDKQLCDVCSNGWESRDGVAKHFSLLTHIFTPLLTEPQAEFNNSHQNIQIEDGETGALFLVK